MAMRSPERMRRHPSLAIPSVAESISLLKNASIDDFESLGVLHLRSDFDVKSKLMGLFGLFQHSETFDAVQRVLESAQNEATRNNKNPQDALLQADKAIRQIG